MREVQIAGCGLGTPFGRVVELEIHCLAMGAAPACRRNIFRNVILTYMVYKTNRGLFAMKFSPRSHSPADELPAAGHRIHENY